MSHGGRVVLVREKGTSLGSGSFFCQGLSSGTPAGKGGHSGNKKPRAGPAKDLVTGDVCFLHSGKGKPPP